MTARRPAAAAAALAGFALVGLTSGTAVAQTYNNSTGPSASDGTAVLNQTITLSTGDGECTPGSTANVAIQGQGFSGSATDVADGTGTATVNYTIPSSARPGAASATFTCPLGTGTNETVVRFSVVPSAAAASAGRLPRTGSDDLGSLTAAGLGLVAAGALVVVAARRRREDAPAGLA